MLVYLGSFLVSFVMLLIVLWVLTESMQKFFYDETVASMFYRSLPAAAICAALAVLVPFELTPPSIWALLLHPVAWVLVFRFLYLFQTPHAVAVGAASSVILVPLATFTYQALFYREAIGA